MEDLIVELNKFSSDIIELNRPIADNRIMQFEEQYSIILPSDFKNFISKINGFNLMGTQVYGFNKANPNSIENVYYREHFEVKVPQAVEIVPFSPDGGGNFYCFDTSQKRSDGTCPVIFWVSNYLYSELDKPEIVNVNFLDWAKQVVIKWTLEDYNYDGTYKQST